MNKHLLLIGDLGAGTNLVKNLCLLDKSYDCPWQDPFNFFLTMYKDTDFNNWLFYEDQTRFWQKRYGFDLSNNLESRDLKNINRTVFINHSAFWQQDQLDKLKDSCDIIFLAPMSDKGLRWQIRAYVVKKGIDKLHNFSFTNPSIEKQSYIDQHGLENYYKFNVLNMYEIIKHRRDQLAKKLTVFDMSNAYKGHNDIVQYFNTLGTNIPTHLANELFNEWYSKHWDYTTTDQWMWNKRYFNGIN